MKGWARAGSFVVWVAVGACRGPVAQPKSRTLPEGTAALVGADRVNVRTVERIAAAQGVGAKAACERAVFDALLAAFAEEHFTAASIRQAERSAAARVLLESFREHAEQQGPPTDAEVAAATERHFWQLDRPSLLRTTHVVVRVKEAGEDAPARALADRIAAAVAGIRDPARFRAAALSVPAGGLTVRVEDLEPVARDGRAVDPAAPPPANSPPDHFSASYVDAAYAIHEIGQQSPVTKTEFGYHVILAVERLPELRIPLEERRGLLAPEIKGSRAERLSAEALEGARKAAPVEIERAAMELTERVKAEP